jgi:hypothetical protein
MCLTCAIPVRGETLGAECLPAVLGAEVRMPEIPEPEPGAVARTVARWAFGLAVLATILPWSRTGVGSGAFGAWTDPPRWSTLVAIAAVAALLLALARGLAPAAGTTWNAVAVVAAGLVAAGAALSLLRPPDFSAPWLGPWVALAAGLAAGIASWVALRRQPPRASV